MRIINIYRKFRKMFFRNKPLADKLREKGMKVGKNVDILNSNIDMLIPQLISIGDNVTITGAILLTHDASTKKILGFTKFGSITIGNDVFIGVNSIILPDTKIGDKVIIGSGCVVAKDIPSNSVVVGNPAKVICTYDEYVKKMRQKIDNEICVDKYTSDILKEEMLIEKVKDAKRGFYL